MSVTTSSANVDPPPLLFGQRSPTPPSFAPFPQSTPQSPRSPHSPRAHPPLLPDDADMSNHNPLPPAPPPDQSESEDSDMDDTDGSIQAPPSNPNPNVSIIDAARTRDPPMVTLHGEQDAMDTSPDPPSTITFGYPNGPSLSFGGLDNPPAPPPPAPLPDGPPIAPVGENLSRINSHGSSIDTGGDRDEHPPEPPPPAVPPPQSTPDSPQGEDAIVDHEDTSDDEDVLPPWRELKDDTSVPDEQELRNIEAMGEHSALDYEYWQQKTFHDLEDPEYTPGPTGRLDWTIPNYNGTKENPNKELVMKSPVVNVGGYDWQIKFYPRGNDSDFLSIYVECLTVAKKGDKAEAQGFEDEASKNANNAPSGGKPQHLSTATALREYQQGPLPLLTEELIPKRPSVAAQVSVVLYNPEEPRTNYHRQCSHRFCPDSPDWGWTRFAGPHYEVHYRQCGQRQALLRNDTLAFNAHIRIINDPTECLWEHHSRENRWDSFAMTGLQGLADSEYDSQGGSLISAVSSWMLLKPFRKFLYELQLENSVERARTKPKPLLAALQKILYRLRTDVQPGCGPVDLDDIADALEWYGTDSCLSKLDVIEIWEILRSKIEFELADTAGKDKFVDLFGLERDRMTNNPTYRAPVKGCPNIQSAIDKSVDMVQHNAPLPKILHVELERQEFNRGNRSMNKVADKVKIMEKITLNRTSYILYGLIVHKDSLQSGSYYSVLRPRGPGSKWYAYYDGKEENRVVCLTQRQAIEEHEGGGSEKSAVAYILMYVRQDVVPKQFSKDEPRWEVPQWLKTRSPAPHSTLSNGTTGEILDYEVFSSTAFPQHEGPGILDPSDPKWKGSPYMSTIELPASTSARDVREALAHRFNAKDPRQIKFWFLDHASGTSHRPNMRDCGMIDDPRDDIDRVPSWTLKTAAVHYPERRIWVRIVDFESLPELLKPVEPPVVDVSGNEHGRRTAVDHGGDSPMNDTDEGGDPNDEQMDLVITEGLAAQAARQHAMDVSNDLDFTLPRPPHLPAVQNNDTVMANDMDAVQGMPPPPPPPPAELTTPPLQPINDNVVVITNPNLSPFDFAIPPPVPHSVTMAQDEIFYFLKTFEPEYQTLKAEAMIVAKKNDRIDHSILDFLGQSHDTALDIYEEGPTIATKLQHRSSITFSQAGINSTSILIVQKPLDQEQASSLAGRALFSDPADYIQHATNTRFATSSTPQTGHFTMDYFSSEHYMGMIVRGRPHGHGRRLYFDGGEYVGSFRLGQRHGSGRLTHPNGDIYEGEWAANLPDGRGSFVEAVTGNSYLGGWKAGKKFGEGVTHWKNAQEVEHLCRICWEEGADAAFYDCGHVVACLACARRVDLCPVCRRKVVNAIKLFFGN